MLLFFLDVLILLDSARLRYVYSTYIQETSSSSLIRPFFPLLAKFVELPSSKKTKIQECGRGRYYEELLVIQDREGHFPAKEILNRIHVDTFYTSDL